MTTVSFLIIISLIIGGIIYTLLSALCFVPVAKAGKVSKSAWRYHNVSPRMLTEIECDGQMVDVSGLLRLYVEGNSMRKWGIQSGQQVFVEQYSDAQKSAITSYPVLLFAICKPKFGDSEYKLRKFVSYVDLSDNSDDYWSKIYDQYSDRISIGREMFVADCKKKASKFSSDEDVASFILSETHDEDLGRDVYSLHKVASVCGQVRYAIE